VDVSSKDGGGVVLERVDICQVASNGEGKGKPYPDIHFAGG
jgi:hypothetical protein